MSERVGIAEARIARSPGVLKAYGLGSCVAISLHDAEAQLGALGHMLLPHWSEQASLTTRGKYVDAGIRQMVEVLMEAGAVEQNLVAKIVGGANMFEAEDQTVMASIGARNAKSARQTLSDLRIPLVAEDVGGNRGRTVSFDLASGEMIVYCARDDLTKTL